MTEKKLCSRKLDLSTVSTLQMIFFPLTSVETMISHTDVGIIISKINRFPYQCVFMFFTNLDVGKGQKLYLPCFIHSVFHHAIGPSVNSRYITCLFTLMYQTKPLRRPLKISMQHDSNPRNKGTSSAATRTGSPAKADRELFNCSLKKSNQLITWK